MRFPPASIQLRRAQLILMLAVLVPTILLTLIGILLLVIGGSQVTNVILGVLVLTMCTSAITGYILSTLFVGKGASLVRVQNDFLASVSHELRTPLTSIRLFMDSLEDGRLGVDEQRQVLTLLRREAERLEKLVTRLLELSRMESGRHAFERARVEVDDLIAEALDSYEAATLTSPCPVELHVEPGLALLGDRATLARAIANLLTNAWKYTGPDKQIQLTARGNGRDIEIEVADNGIGLPPDEQRDIFDEFARGKEAVDRGTAGIGLGLALVRAITRAHHGKIQVLSRPGEGSTFTLFLPRGKLEMAAREKLTAVERHA